MVALSLLPSPVHTPEPRQDGFRRPDGRPAALFNVRDYPVTAICRRCGREIRAKTFYQPFQHVEGSF